MEFKCKQCGNDKYRQINTFVKQCLFCGRNIISEGTKSEDLDWTNEITEDEKLSTKFIYDNDIYIGEITYKQLLKQMEDLMDLPIMRAGRNIANE